MSIFSEIFSWWGGNTWGTRLYTLRRGRLVGADDEGNRYYEQNKGVGPLGVPRRWVVYKNLAEASNISPDWHGWMHHTEDLPPGESTYTPRPWQQPHRPNPTGSPDAQRPRGSILKDAERPAATGDYKAWQPE